MAHEWCRARPHGVMVCSIPKAGTYLVGKMLTCMGLKDTGWHVGPDTYQDYGAAEDIVAAKHNPKLVTHSRSLTDTIGLLTPGSFAVSHCGAEHFLTLAPAVIIFLIRDLRSCVVSYARWTKTTDRWKKGPEPWRGFDGPAMVVGFLQHFGAKIARNFQTAASWHLLVNKCPDLTLRFEDLVGDNGSETQVAGVRSLATLMSSETNPDEIIRQSVGAKTLTWSGQLTDIDDYWDDEVEGLFRKLALETLNRDLGYD